MFDDSAVNDSLSAAQQATFAPFVMEWRQRFLACEPLSDRRRAALVEELRRAYLAAGLPWPGRVWWVPSPLIGELGARTAAATVQRDHEMRIASAASRRQRMAAALRGGAGRLLLACWTVGVAVIVYAVFWAVGATTVAICVEDAQRKGFVIFCTVLGGLLGGASGLNQLSHDRMVRADTAARAANGRAVAEIDATGRRVQAALFDVGSPRSAAVEDLIGDGVEQPVEQACGPARAAIDDGLRSMALGTSRTRPRRVNDLVRRIIDVSEPATVPSARVTANLTRPRTGLSAAWLWFHRHVDDASTLADLDAVAALAGADHIWWWAHPEFVIVTEPPAELHVETAGAGCRPHRPDGPAVRWRDGLRLYFWHGTRVPAGLIETGWTVEEIHRHHNSEVRRAAIERMGWLTYIERAGLHLLASAPDPGNPPHQLHLYEDPQRRLGQARVLVMTNGSPAHIGQPLLYAETVPGHIDDPVEAAAWQYDCPVDIYRTLQRRT